MAATLFCVFLMTFSILEIGGVKFCPFLSRVVTEDDGCDICKCCITISGDYLVDCKSLKLTKVPSVPPDVTHLDLRYNPIQHLYNDSFPVLKNLTELQLGSYDFFSLEEYALNSAEVGTFRNLPHLSTIVVRIALNETNEFLSSAQQLNSLFILCENTQTAQEQKVLFSFLHLDYLQAKRCDCILHHELFNMPPKQLLMTDIMRSSINYIDLPGSSVDIEYGQYNFRHLSECLNMSRALADNIVIECGTTKVDVSPRLLDWVDVTSSAINIVIEGFKYTKLDLGKHRFQSLVIDISHFTEEEFDIFIVDLMKSLRTTSLKVLHIVSTGFLHTVRGLSGDEFLRAIIRPALSELEIYRFQFEQVQKLDFNLTTFKCKGCAFDCDYCIYAPSLRNLTIEDSPSFVRINLSDVLTSHRDMQHLVLANINQLNFGTFDLQEHKRIRRLELWPTVMYSRSLGFYYTFNVSGLANLQILLIKNVVFHTDHKSMSSSNFTMKNLRKLTYFYFGDNSIQIRGPLDDMFCGLDSLRELHLVNNPFWSNISQLRGMLKPVSKTLTSLDLSGNNIDSLPVDLFADLINLLSLDLNGNILTSIDGNLFRKSQFLTLVNVDANHLETIGADSVHVLSRMQYLRLLSLALNRLHCTCENRNLRDWIKKSLDEGLLEFDGAFPFYPPITEAVCFSPGYLKSEGMKFVNFTLPWIACDFHREGVIIGCVLLAMVLIVGAIYGVYYYRHDIIFWWIVKRRPRVMRCNNPHPERQFHAFLSYTSSEQDLAHHMFFELEDGADVQFKIAYDCRDFMPGITIADNIIHFIDRSEKVIFLISRRFLEREWCEFEMNFAQMRCFDERQNLIILVFVEKFKKSELPKRIRTLMRHVNYLEFPDEADVRGRHNFWKRLKVALARDSEIDTSPRQERDNTERFYDLPDETTPLINEGQNSNSLI